MSRLCKRRSHFRRKTRLLGVSLPPGMLSLSSSRMASNQSDFEMCLVLLAKLHFQIVGQLREGLLSDFPDKDFYGPVELNF